MAYNRKDRFYKKAKDEGYPARSAYKIIEMDKKFGIFKPGNTVVDLGCAPGGWFKVGMQRLKNSGRLIGVDLLPLKCPRSDNTLFIQGDFNDPHIHQALQEKLNGKTHWVISDLSPDISGIKFKDQSASLKLCEKALSLAEKVLKPGGNFLCKIFPGPETEGFKKTVGHHFKKTVTFIPESTRKSSIEIYLVCLGLQP